MANKMRDVAKERFWRVVRRSSRPVDYRCGRSVGKSG